MKICVLLLCCVLVLPLMASDDRCTTQQLSQWVESSLSQIEKLQVGMTRADVERLFVSDGGISTRYRQTYVFRECPHIKIDVEFSPTEAEGGALPVRPTDRITVISKPYLAPPTTD